MRINHLTIKCPSNYAPIAWPRMTKFAVCGEMVWFQGVRHTQSWRCGVAGSQLGMCENRKSVRIRFLKTEPSKNLSWHPFRRFSDRNSCKSTIYVKSDKKITLLVFKCAHNERFKHLWCAGTSVELLLCYISAVVTNVLANLLSCYFFASRYQSQNYGNELNFQHFIYQFYQLSRFTMHKSLITKFLLVSDQNPQKQ